MTKQSARAAGSPPLSTRAEACRASKGPGTVHTTGKRRRLGRIWGPGVQVSRPRLWSPSPTFSLLICRVEITGKSKRGKVCLRVEGNTCQIVNSQYISVTTIFLCKTCHIKIVSVGKRKPLSATPWAVQSVRGTLQARTLEWVAIPSPAGPPDPGIELGSLPCRHFLPVELSCQESLCKTFHTKKSVLGKALSKHMGYTWPFALETGHLSFRPCGSCRRGQMRAPGTHLGLGEGCGHAVDPRAPPPRTAE